MYDAYYVAAILSQNSAGFGVFIGRPNEWNTCCLLLCIELKEMCPS